MNKIDYDTRAVVYRDAIVQYGHMAQTMVAIEEMSELTKELCKLINRGGNNMDRVAEEIADVTIMMEQLRIMYGINEEVCEHMDLKVERLHQRLIKADQG